jgi:uncharacterized membrane protein
MVVLEALEPMEMVATSSVVMLGQEVGLLVETDQTVQMVQAFPRVTVLARHLLRLLISFRLVNHPRVTTVAVEAEAEAEAVCLAVLIAYAPTLVVEMVEMVEMEAEAVSEAQAALVVAEASLYIRLTQLAT